MTKVIDTDRSERGQQRRRTASGRPLHCCCVCGRVEPWSASWSWYGSIKDADDEAPFPKLCSPACASVAGKNCKDVTGEMRQRAKDAEWRAPEMVWREATEREKYAEAAYAQRRKSSLPESNNQSETP